MHFGVGDPPPIEGLQILGFFFENLSTVVYGIRKSMNFKATLRNVESQDIEELFGFRRMLVFNKFDGFFIV